MKKFVLTFLFINNIYLINLSSQNMSIPIVPKPHIITVNNNGFYYLHNNLTIAIQSKDYDKIIFSAKQLKQSIETNLKLKCSITKSGSGDIVLLLNPKFQLKEAANNKGSYLLSISNRNINIESSTAKGVFYGTISLIQLLEKIDAYKLPSIDIKDWADMKVRGVSDDISRGQVSTLENFKRIIKHIARYKMNTYMPYIEDVLKIDAYPTIGKNRGALTKEEIKELLAYAEKYYVDVIPIFQTLGHYENILLQPEFLKYAEFPGAASLDVSNDSIYIFLEKMLKEVFALFPSKYFHMGADESYDVGLGNSQRLVNESNIAIVHANHYKKVYDICKKYGKKVLMYGDIILRHPEILSLIPKDIIIVDWHYRPANQYPSTEIFRKAGFKYYVSPASWNFLTTFPTNINAIPNIKYIIKAGLNNDSEGMINSNWGDYGAETFKEFILFDYAWSAQCAWNYKQSNISEFSNNYFYDFFGIRDDRLNQIYETLSNPFNQMMWHEVWRHPLLPFRKPVWWESKTSPVSKIEWMNWSLPRVLEDINYLEDKVIKNKEHFRLLRFILKLDEWYKLKLQTQFLLHDKMENEASVKNDSLSKMIEKNISSLHNLKNDYMDLWIRYYKKDNLHLIEDKFDRLSTYFTEIKKSLKSTGTLSSPLIKSEWIYVKNTDSSFASQAEFKKVIDLYKIPDKAYIQLMGDTYTKLYINNKFVDEVFAKRSLSLLVDYKRIKFLDVKKYLKIGQNVFTVTVQNFSTNGAAGFNISSLFIIGDTTLNINTHPGSWAGKSSGSEWHNVVSKDYPFEVIAPNFKTGRPSWIER